MAVPAAKKRRRTRRRNAARPVFAAIDVGTNACRLLVAVPQNDAMAATPRIIGAYTANVRLGEGVEQGGRIGEAALERVVKALKICAQQLRRFRVTHVRAVATEACRRAANAGDLVARVREETGIALTVVTPEEEARLAAEGCLPLIGAEYKGALVFDIGGGSTELVLMQKKETGDYAIGAWASSPDGVVTLAEQHGGHNLPSSVFGAMRARVDTLLDKAHAQIGPEDFDPENYHLLGTSGTLTTLTGIHLGLKRYRRHEVDGQWMGRDVAVRLCAQIGASDFAARAAIPCIGKDRADLILPGCAILESIMDHWPCAQLRVADRGLREGMLVGLLRETAGAERDSA